MHIDVSRINDQEYAERMLRAAKSEAHHLEDYLPGHVAAGPLDPSKTPVITGSRRPNAPTLNLRDYVVEQVELPPVVHRVSSGGKLSDALGNNEWGDCGDAMTLHGIEAFHLDAGTPVPPFVTDDALKLYSEVSGFDRSQGPPGENPTDVGTDNGQLVKYWQNPGVTCAADGSVHRIAGSLAIDPADPQASYLERLAVWEFVVLFRAVALPITAQGQKVWKLTDPSLQGNAAPGSWGYHDIPYLAYDRHWFYADSWGFDILVGFRFNRSYAAGGFVVLTEEQTNLQGVSPAGINWTKLNEDFRNLPQQPVQ